MVGRSIPLTMFTDSESIFKTVLKYTVNKEKRLMMDVRAATMAYITG